MDVKPGPARTRNESGTAARVAEAAVSVVARDGFDVLSVRAVARAAGMSGGAVQYHYATRAKLLLAAFACTVNTISERLAATDLSGPLPIALGRLCREALPLDPQRHRECAVWAALSAAAATHPELAAEHAAALHALTWAVADLIAAARTAGQLDDAVDPLVAASILTAVLDGLTLHGIAGSRSAESLTSTLDASIDLVLRTSPDQSGG